MDRLFIVPDATVFILLVLAYAGAILFGAWFVLHAEARNNWQLRASNLGTLLAHRTAHVFGRISFRTRYLRDRLGTGKSALAILVLKYRWLITSATVLLLLPVLLAISLQPFHTLRPYDDSPQQRNPVVTALLQGEQLVPPPSLPPDVFITQEVETVRQALSGASREWMMLDADFRQRLLTIFQLMAKKGYQMALIEGYRSPARQSYLASLGSQVTNAGAYQSYHQFGLASDCAFYRDGKLVISEKDPWAMEGYRLYGELAESVGLTWGGRWKMMDFGHVELRRRNKINDK